MAEKMKQSLLSEISLSLLFSIALGGGGIVLVGYYHCINYLPDFDFASTFSVLIAVSASAVLLVVPFILVLMLPALFWLTFQEVDEAETSAKSESSSSVGEERVVERVTWQFALPMVGIVIALFLAISVDSWWPLLVSCLKNYWLCFLVLVSIPFIVMAILALRKKPKDPKKLKKFCGKAFDWFGRLLSWLCGFVGLIIAVYALRRIVPVEQIGDAPEGLVWFALSLVVLLFNSFVLVLEVDSYRGKALLVVTVLLLFIFLNIADSCAVPKRVASILKIGNFEVSELVVTPQGCSEINSGSVELDVNSDGYCVLRDVLVLSRLGREAYLEVENKKTDETIQFFLKTEHIAPYIFKEGVVKGDADASGTDES